LDEFASQPDAFRPDLNRPVDEQFDELTAREREVMTLVAFGLTNHEIAKRLVVSPATAKTHVSRAMVKLQVRDRAKLVALAYSTGFVRPRQHESGTGFVQPVNRGSQGVLSRRPVARPARLPRPVGPTRLPPIRAV
jgi:DNA-binding CsgD family transcriptional regulator